MPSTQPRRRARILSLVLMSAMLGGVTWAAPTAQASSDAPAAAVHAAAGSGRHHRVGALAPSAATPSAPQRVVASGAPRSARVTWSAPARTGRTAITGYRVWTSPRAGACVTTGARRCTLRGLTNGRPYTVYIAARNAAGYGVPARGPSRVVPLGAPGPVQGVSANFGDGRVHVRWSAPRDDGGVPVTGYTVVVRSPVGSSSPGCWSTMARSCVLTGLPNGRVSTVRIVAENRLGAGAPVDVKGTPVGRPPEAPSGVIAVPGPGSAWVIWRGARAAAGQPATDYEVVSQPDGRTCTAAVTPACRVEGLRNGVAHTFRVRARNANGWSALSVASNEVVPSGVPGSPQLVTVTARAGSVLVSWSPPTDTGGAALVEYLVTVSPSGAACTVPAGTTQCVVGGLRPARAYTFKVAARNANGIGPGAVSEPIHPRVSTVSAIAHNGRLEIDVNPDGVATAGWQVLVERESAVGRWDLVDAYTTSTVRETASLALGAGLYRVRVPAQYGYGESAPSHFVRLRGEPLVRIGTVLGRAGTVRATVLPARAWNTPWRVSFFRLGTRGWTLHRTVVANASGWADVAGLPSGWWVAVAEPAAGFRGSQSAPMQYTAPTRR